MAYCRVVATVRVQCSAAKPGRLAGETSILLTRLPHSGPSADSLPTVQKNAYT